MFAKRVRDDDAPLNTIIGPGTVIDGDLRVSGFVRVDGDITSNIEATGTVIVNEKARVTGNIRAKSALVGGTVKGNIEAADRIQLFATASVAGDLLTRRIEVAANAVFNGHCIALRDLGSYDAALALRKNAPAAVGCG
jgi:cytoskeletal protein CcmA (bactofilin family)